jgi:RNA polymerase sigma factor (sigma-70 family)
MGPDDVDIPRSEHSRLAEEDQAASGTGSDELEGAESCSAAGGIEPLLGYLAVVARNLTARDRAGPEGASDLVQGTVAAALDQIGRGRGPGGAAGEWKAWLRGIMLNLRRQRWRRLERRPSHLTSDDIDADTTSPSGKASRAELIARMARARDSLGADDRRLLDWRHRDQLTFEAIGEQLGVSAVAAHKAHRRALCRLENAFRAAASELESS